MRMSLVKLSVFVATLFLTCKLFSCQISATLFNYFGLCLFTLLFAWQSTNLVIKFVISKWINNIDPKNKAVFVTGCDSGFGHLTAKVLNKYGFKVFAACLFPDGEGAQSLRQTSSLSDKMIIIKMNLLKEEDIDNAFKTIKDNLNEEEILWAIVNNAGVAVPTFFEWTTFERQFTHQFNVNLFGTIKVTRKFLPLIRASKGRVVNVSSMAGPMPSVGLTSYAMTKNALISFSDGLRREMRQFGVHVACLEPSFYGTELLHSIPSLLTQSWNETSEEVKVAYTQDLFDKMLSYSKFVTKFMASKRIEDVPNAVLKALTTNIEEPRYLVADSYLKPLNSLGPLLPSEFQDLFFSL